VTLTARAVPDRTGDEPRTLPGILARAVEREPDRIAYRYKSSGRWVDVTWREHADRVSVVAKALIAAGVRAGDRVAILSASRIEWVSADCGILDCGGVTVGVYPSLLSDDCAYVLDHAGAVLAFVENLSQLEKIEAARDRLPQLRHVVVLDDSAGDDRGIVGWSEFLSWGEGVPDDTLAARRQAVAPSDLATLVYTSGTTGLPKGVMLSHGNWAFTTWSATRSLEFRPEFTSLLFLPLAHVFARLMVYCAMRRSCTVAFAESLEQVPANLVEIRPHFVAGVPRFYEKVQEKVVAKARSGGAVRHAMFRAAVAIGRAASRRVQRGRSVPTWLRAAHSLADRLVLHRVRAIFGGRLVWAVSGAAPLAPSVAEFYDACGVNVLEGIGMTENTSFSNVNRIGHNRFGTVGTPGPGIEIAIAPDGEILCRGDNVMLGYFRDPEATAATIGPDGWLRTGDVGEILDDGSLRITDRKKDLIVTSGGKNIAPQRIEVALRRSPFISQAVVFGDRRKYITAMVTLDRDHLREWARTSGVTSTSHEELVASEEVHAAVRVEIDAANRTLASYETVKRFAIHPREFTIEAGELTPTLKLKRRVIVERYADVFEGLYSGSTPENS
jgi:long-chain acyl-CoA synthetase